jgi:hypothetical protein
MSDRLCGLKIDYKLELGRLLDRHIGGLYSTQQLHQLAGENVPKNLFEARAIGDEASLLRLGRPLPDSGQAERRNALQDELTIV